MTPKNEFSILQYDERDAHLAHLEITRQWNRIALPYTIVCVLMFGVSLLVWILQLNFAIGVFTLFIAMLCLIFIRVSIRSLHFSRSHVNRRFEEWQQNQAMLRYIANQKAQSDITVNKGGQAVINQGNAQTQVVMMNDSKDVARFIKHRREFIQRAEERRKIEIDKTGFERNYWLHANINNEPYQWEDGTRVGAPEYEQLIETLEATPLEPVGRRKGARGQVKTTPLLSEGTE